MGLDGALNEHIRFARKISLIVQNLQRAEQRVGGILPEGQPVSHAGQQAVLFGEAVIQPVELRLFLFDFPVRSAQKLQFNELSGAVPDGNHPFDTGGLRFSQVHRPHPGIFPKVKSAVHFGKTEIAHLWVSRKALCLLAVFLPRRVGQKQLPVRRADVLHGFRQLFRKAGTRLRQAGGFRLVAVHILKEGHLSQHHFRMIQVIAV